MLELVKVKTMEMKVEELRFRTTLVVAVPYAQKSLQPSALSIRISINFICQPLEVQPEFKLLL